MPSLPSTLFHISSALNAIAIPGHITYGTLHMNPALRRMVTTPENSVSRASACAAWDYVNALLAALVLLNHLWATNGGPKTLEEKAIIWITVLVASAGGWRFFKVRSYSPLGTLWVAPPLSLVAMLLQQNS